MTFKRLFIQIALLVVAVGAVSAQANTNYQQPVAQLRYFAPSDSIEIITAEGLTVSGNDIYPGYEVGLGSIVKTLDGIAELQLQPNGSIIKLAENTEFKVEALQNRDGSEANLFTLYTGKMRAIAARAEQSAYSIQTPSTVCGVRGTDFSMHASQGESDAVFVRQGSVTFSKVATGESLVLNAGQYADAFSGSFQPANISQSRYNSLFSGLSDFNFLNPGEVPGHNASEGVDVGSLPAQEEIVALGDEETDDDSPAADVTTPVGGDDALATADNDDDDAEATGTQEVPSEEDAIMAFLGDVLGMEIGAVVIGGKTYSKAVLSPTLKFGDFEMALYLPVIYKNNLFDPQDWYKPNGNDEWSFGRDQGDDPVDITMDALNDIVLKIKYLQYGEAGMDDFYFGVGSLPAMTIGHGSLMKDFANDIEFPAVRNIGINAGYKFDPIGVEFVADHIADPEVIGGRFYFNPTLGGYKGFAVGVSSIVDLYPARVLPSYREPFVGNPLFLTAGLDFEFFKINTDLFSSLIYTDLSLMAPYFREDASVYGISSGLATEAIIGSDWIPRNYGVNAGVMGNIFAFNYVFEFRYFNGTYRPSFFDSRYQRVRGDYVVETLRYLQNSEADEYKKHILGLFGSAEMDIFGYALFEAGYMWPWEFGPDGIDISEKDELNLKLSIPEDVVPVINVSGSISYDRTYFAPTLMGAAKDSINQGEIQELDLFDQYTSLSGEMVYAFSENFDLALIVATVTARNAETGAVQYNEDGSLKIIPTYSIETRVSF